MKEDSLDIMEGYRNLEEMDKNFIWHPFTQMSEWQGERPVIITEGCDCFIRDIAGRWYLDGVSSLWVNLFGHRKKQIDEAIKIQIDRISHSSLLGLTNVPAIQLAERLIHAVKSPFSDHPLSKVFYSDNGSTAVEVALKMAFQYWRHKGVETKSSFLALNNAYHGDTLGAVSVGGISIFHEAFSPLLFRTFRAPSPYCYRCEVGRKYPDCGISCLESMEGILRDHHREIAALIIEPLVQAAGGMIVSPPGYLRGAAELCKRYDVLFIADEVATGFGRTGKMFACEHEAVVPDLICLSKGITGGYMPLAATIAREEIYRAFLGAFRDLKTFFHGHSYTGNQLACSAALAVLDIFEEEEILERLKPKIILLESWLRDVSGLPHVGDVRSKGLMAGIELVKDKKTKEPYAWEEKTGWKVAHYARDKSVLIRPLGNVAVIMPPLTISEENLIRMLKTIKEAITAVTG